MIKKIDSLKSDITSTFIKTQNLIISSYFDKQFHTINDLESVENYRRKLYNFKDYYRLFSINELSIEAAPYTVFYLRDDYRNTYGNRSQPYSQINYHAMDE